MRNKWFIKPKNGGLIELAEVIIDKNKGKFTTQAGFQDTEILVCFGIDHKIKITNVEPLRYSLSDTLKKNKITIIGDLPEANGVIEGWAIYDFEFIDFDEKIIKLYEKYINPNNINPNITHPINIIKDIKSIIEEYNKEPNNIDN